MKRIFKNHLYLLIFFVITLIFFYQFVLGLYPIPADTIVALYHPFRDLYASTNPNGLPFKNFLITDPVRQLYPWKELVLNSLGSFVLPLWNPYEMAGKPLLANFQSGTFYLFNLILFIKPFFFSWSIYIYLQVLLAGVFQYLYLRNLKLQKMSSLLGSIAFAFSGFMTVWLEWGNIGHTLLWLPLIFFSIDKITSQNAPISKKWYLLFAFSVICSFFAGHLQIFFYIYLFSLIYFVFRLISSKQWHKTLFYFLIFNALAIIITSIQWISTMQFINLSARVLDQSLFHEGWFIPLQNIVGFIIPDFFGNPTTLNYWGVWNYAEFSGYIGVIPLFFASLSFFNLRHKSVLFFTISVIVFSLFAFSTPLAKIPYNLHIPFISTSQPTRLLSIISFSLAVLAAIGLEYFIAKVKDKRRDIKGAVVFFVNLFIFIWILVYNLPYNENIHITQRNLILPSIFALIVVISALVFTHLNKSIWKKAVIYSLIILSALDLFRYFVKFETFSKKEYIYPESKIIRYLQQQQSDNSQFRIISLDNRIFPPNFSTHYKIQSVEGYDPLFLLSYAQFIAAMERDNQSIKPPFGYNRIITPHNINSTLFPYLNVKYVLSLSDINDTALKKIMKEGKTQLYEYTDVLPRAFFVEEVIFERDKQMQITKMSSSPLGRAVIEEKEELVSIGVGSVQIVKYENNQVVMKTQNDHDGFLVLLDTFYPTWTVYIDGQKRKIYKTDFTFRGVYVPRGTHSVEFKNYLF